MSETSAQVEDKGIQGDVIRQSTSCSNVYTDRWVYHFVNVLQGCYKDRFRCFASFFLFYRIIQLSAVIFTQRAEDALFIQLLAALTQFRLHFPRYFVEF